MRVWYNTTIGKHYIHCVETRNTRFVRGPAARQVASCCEIEIEKFTDVQITKEKEKYNV